jgi:hypothetical protein
MARGRVRRARGAAAPGMHPARPVRGAPGRMAVPPGTSCMRPAVTAPSTSGCRKVHRLVQMICDRSRRIACRQPTVARGRRRGISATPTRDV